MSRARGKERAREHHSYSRASAGQDRAVSTSGLQEELSCVEEEIRDSRARLLQGLLLEERATFLQSRLKKECHQMVPRVGRGAAGLECGGARASRSAPDVHSGGMVEM